MLLRRRRRSRPGCVGGASEDVVVELVVEDAGCELEAFGGHLGVTARGEHWRRLRAENAGLRVEHVVAGRGRGVEMS